MSTGCGMLDLIAHVYRRALKDAKRGQPDAISFLDATAGDWRERVNRRPGQNTQGHAEKRSGGLLVRSGSRGIGKSVVQHGMAE